HPLHVHAPTTHTKDELTSLMKDADLIMSLDWIDLAGTFKALGSAPTAKVIQVTLDQNLHNGWSMDYQGLPPVDLFIAADPDATTRAMVKACGPPSARATDLKPQPLYEPPKATGTLGIENLAQTLREKLGDRPASLTHLPLSWQGSFWHFRDPLDYLGSDGGG